jgi:hypothetical protein
VHWRTGTDIPSVPIPTLRGIPYVPHNIQEHIEIPDDVFEEVKETDDDEDSEYYEETRTLKHQKREGE